MSLVQAALRVLCSTYHKHIVCSVQSQLVVLQIQRRK